MDLYPLDFRMFWFSMIDLSVCHPIFVRFSSKNIAQSFREDNCLKTRSCLEHLHDLVPSFLKVKGRVHDRILLKNTLFVLLARSRPPYFLSPIYQLHSLFLQIMPWKHIVVGPSKRPRDEASILGTNFTPTFHTQVLQEHYTHLSHHRFGESREIDWDVLLVIKLEDEVQWLLSVGVWR